MRNIREYRRREYNRVDTPRSVYAGEPDKNVSLKLLSHLADATDTLQWHRQISYSGDK